MSKFDYSPQGHENCGDMSLHYGSLGVGMGVATTEEGESFLAMHIDISMPDEGKTVMMAITPTTLNRHIQALCETAERAGGQYHSAIESALRYRKARYN